MSKLMFNSQLGTTTLCTNSELDDKETHHALLGSHGGYFLSQESAHLRRLYTLDEMINGLPVDTSTVHGILIWTFCQFSSRPST